ncbi:PEP-CTERM sorting domain-containing protein [Sphingomonas sp.]|uniref:PEP-CTERM sorting domain-containing protein n=1 Tax=Sphingomonas sp. TaxID=28214 RepID=UPI0031D2BEF1
MKQAILGAIAVLATLSAAPAFADVSSTSYLNPPAYASDTTLIDFTNGIPSGFSLNGGSIRNDSTSTGWYQGALMPTGGSGNYLAVGATSGTQAVLKATGSDSGWGSVSLLWGTIDWFNSLDVLDTLGNTIATITGSAVTSRVTPTWTASDNNRYVTYTIDPNSGRQIGGLRFNSLIDSFEIDNIAFSNPTSVPEPGTIALFTLGVVTLLALRGRRPKVQALGL